MSWILKLIVNAVVVLVTAYILPGVEVDDFTAALIVALVISILNVLVKPMLVIITIPITIVTFGLFLIVINGLIILLVDKLIDGFYVSSFWWALLFSFVLSFFNSIVKENKKEK